MIQVVLALLLTGRPELAFPVEKYTLDNGLEVLLSPDHRLPIVAVNIWYHVGPVNEPPGQVGFAHLFEHLMFRGSENVAEGQHVHLLRSVGATSINGTTSFDRTNYFESVPSNQLELALWLESDRMGFLLPALDQRALSEQVESIRAERRQTIDLRPYGPSTEAFYQALFPRGHPYHGFLIGSADDLTSITLKDAREFYLHHYSPANATLAVVGDFDPKPTKALIARYFGNLPRRPPPKPRTIVTPPIAREIRLTVNEPVELARIQLGWHSPPAFHRDDAVADVLAVLLGQGKTSRLHRRLIEKEALASSVAASQGSLQLRSVFSIQATARAQVPLGQLETALQEELDALTRAPPGAEELERARNRLRTEVLLDLQRVGARADRLNRSNHYRGGSVDLTHELDRYREVTAADVQRLARDLLRTNRRVVVITVPTR